MISDVSLVIGFVDQPTDGVLDYCERLATTLRLRGMTVDIASRAHDGSWNPKPPWAVRGGTCIVQFTKLAWSRRGFPLRLLPVMWRIKRAGRTLAIVFHDPNPFQGVGLVATGRRGVQVAVMRRALAWSARAVTTVEPELVEWFGQLPPDERRKVVHIPVGSNIPIVDHQRANPPPFTVSVFGVTEHSEEEARWIARVVAGVARETEVRLQMFGRGALIAEPILVAELTGSGVALACEGVLPPGVVAERLGETDAALFGRGAATRRGSMIAAITTGIPVVATRSPETGPLVERSGVLLVDREDVQGATDALVRLARDPELRRVMRERNRAATREAFSWDAIADRFVDMLA